MDIVKVIMPGSEGFPGPRQQGRGHEMAEKKAVRPGDRFMKVGGQVTMVVRRLLELPNCLHPHAQLVSEQARSRTTTLSVSALLDRRLFRPVDVG